MKDYLVLNDSYNGNLGSFMALKKMILDLDIEGKKFIVLGAFKELGKFSYKAHKTVIQGDYFNGFEKIFLIGKEYQEIKKSENLNSSNLYYFNSFENFIDCFVQKLESKCFVVIKGSRSNRLERIFDYS